MKLLKSLTWMVMIMLAIGFIGCSDDDDDNPVGTPSTDNFDAIYDTGDAYFTAGTKNIPASTLYAEMQEDNNLFIIDWRSAADYDLAHIPGAVNWARADLVDNMDQIPSGAKVVNVCYSGQTASQITSAMHLLGYDEAYNLLFGMSSWTSNPDVPKGGWGGDSFVKNVALSMDTETIPSTTYDYPARDGEMADYIDEYLTEGTKNVWADQIITDNNDGDDLNDWYVLNYWPMDQYEAGHIPGAWQAKPITMDLLSHIPADANVAVYCYTGQTSSQLTLWLNALGYNAHSVLYGMNSIYPNHPNNHGFPGAEDYTMEGTLFDN